MNNGVTKRYFVVFVVEMPYLRTTTRYRYRILKGPDHSDWLLNDVTNQADCLDEAQFSGLDMSCCSPSAYTNSIKRHAPTQSSRGGFPFRSELLI